MVNAAVCNASAFCKDQNQWEQSTKTCFTAIINLLFEGDGAVGLGWNTPSFCFLVLSGFLGCGTAVWFRECIADLAVFIAAEEREGRDVCLTLHTLRVS